MSRMNYAVVVEDGHPEYTGRIAEKLTRQGFTVESVIPELGAIYGSADEALISKLRAIPGVEEVRCEDTVTLPPLSSACPQ